MLSPNAAEALLLHAWPQNVRELGHVLTAAAVRAGDAQAIRVEHLPAAIAAAVTERRTAAAGPVPLELLVPRDRTPCASDLRLVIERLGGNLARVAEYFDKDRRQIYRWLERHGISPSTLREE